MATGVILEKGELLIVRVLPRSVAATEPSVRPSETGSYLETRSRAPAVVLVGRIGKAPFKVGTAYQGEAAASGELFLRVNVRAGSYDNNVAAVRAGIYHVSKASPQPSAIPLPNFVGTRFRAAAKTLARLGLATQRQTLASDHPAGEIVRQRPEPGVDIRTLNLVILEVSSGLASGGTETPRMPNLVGRSRGYAQKAVGAAAPIKPTFMSGFSDVPAGQVYRQVPAPGVDLRTVRAIEIYVSSGPPPIAPTAIPPPRPRPPSRPSTPRPTATPRPTPTSRPTPTVRPKATHPPVSPAPRPPASPAPRPTASSHAVAATAAASVAPTKPVATPRVAAVPMVVGYSQRDAVATVERSNLRSVNRGAEPSRLVRGQVTRTDPVAGSALKTGSLVGYWVADGTNAVPDLSGQSSTEAGTILRESGFRLGTIVHQSDADQRVTHQDPVAGTSALVGSAVTITVGKRNAAWVVVLIPAGLLLALLGGFVVQRARLARTTRSLLSIHPSVDFDGPTEFSSDIRSAGPTVGLQASVEPGELSIQGDVPIVRHEVRND